MFRSLTLSPLDWIALALFVLAWFGYGLFSTRRSKTQVSLLNVMTPLRGQWLQMTLKRDNRILDSQLLGNLIQSASFFSSTTILILGGLLALLGTVDKNIELVDSIPFATKATAQALELKVLLMVVLFMFAFVKFSWSLRQYNFVTILIGAMPTPADVTDFDQKLSIRAANILQLASENFTQGLRAYYFALPVLLWIINPILFMVMTVFLVYTLYRMEFHSNTLEALRD
jgi:uncharacterized membrane protein